MGRPKIELKKIHRRKIKKTKEKVKNYLDKSLPCKKLTTCEKHLLKKQKKIVKE